MGFASAMLAGGLILLLLAAVARQHVNWPPQPQATWAWAWAYLVVFGSLLAFNAYMVLLARAAGLAASYSFVNPVIAMLLGIGFGGESVAAGVGVQSGQLADCRPFFQKMLSNRQKQVSGFE